MGKKSRTLKGGKYLYHGTYGCAYKPAMKCKGDADRYPNAISKIMETRDASEEYAKRALLQPIDPDQEFFVWPMRMCSVDRNDLTAENNLGPCPHPGDMYRTNLKNASLLIYKDGGVDLEHIGLRRTDYVNFFRGLGRLFEGLALLHSRDVVHLDIKPSNLVGIQLPTGEFVIRYIDFGFMTAIQRYDDAGLPNENYKYWPFEYRFAEADFTKESIAEGSIDAWKETIEEYDELEGLEEITVAKELTNFDIFQSMGTSRKARMIPLLKAVDVFSLGVSLLEVYMKRIGHQIQYSNEKGEYTVDVRNDIKVGPNTLRRVVHYTLMKNLSRPFLGLLAKMTTIHLGNRITAQQAYEEFQAIVSNFDLLTPMLVDLAFKGLPKPPRVSPPPTPGSLPSGSPTAESPGASRNQPRQFKGGKRKTQRKRR